MINQTDFNNKTSIKNEIMGQLDSINSILGLGINDLNLSDKDKKFILNIQKDISICLNIVVNNFENLDSLKKSTDRIKNEKVYMETLFPKPKEFVIHQENKEVALIDLIRTTIRTFERYLHLKNIDKCFVDYFDLLSDYFFSMSRMLAFRENVLKNLQKDKANIILNLETAKEIAEFIENEASSHNENVVICVSNKDGNPILMHAMDNSFMVSFDLCRTKAFTAAALQMSTTELGKLTKRGGDFEGLEKMVDQKIVTIGGGSPIFDGNICIGSVAVSGSTASRDEYMAKIGASFLNRR